MNGCSMRKAYSFLYIALMFMLNGCAPMPYSPSLNTQTPLLTDNLFFSDDGVNLALHRWLPKKEIKAVLIALHGFNDYGNFFDRPGTYLSSKGIVCLAYDQRGFGAAPKRGQWAGTSRYINDLYHFVRLVRQRYSHQPIYLLGESMGGAVIISAMAQLVMPKVDGVILVAPALWARETMPWYQTSLLWALSRTVPWLRLTGESVGVQASDNIPMLREMGRDPLIIKKTSVGAINGLVNLMDNAYFNADKLHGRTLILYGEKDEVIPKQPTYDFIQRFLENGQDNKTVAIYPKGYHMLLRDLEAKIPWHDIEMWINSSYAKLPSGSDRYAVEALKHLLGSVDSKVVGRQG
jgi:alpha-beta hydrolase superfamily lysophospholipase